MDLTAMKVLNVLFFLCALYILFAAFNGELPFSYLAGAIAIVALSPYFWNERDEVISDMLFLLLCYATLWVSTGKVGKWSARTPLHIMVTAACVYLAFATRAAAVILLPTLIAADLVQLRKLRFATVASVAVAGTLMFGQVLLFPGYVRYADQVSTQPAVHTVRAATKANIAPAGHRRFVDDVVRCSRALMWQTENELWDNPDSVLLTKVLCVIAFLLGAAGYAIRLRRGPGVFDVFAAGYLAMIILWRAPDLRLLIPLIPLWVLWAATTLEAMSRAVRGKFLAHAILALILVQLGLAYGVAYAQAQQGEIQTGIGDPRFRSLCDYIKHATPRNAVFIYAQPRLLALMTERSASAYYRPGDDAELWDYFREISATHLVSASWIPSDRDYLAGFIVRAGARLHEVFRNDEFAVYEILYDCKCGR
jgi:hypothetical protein